MKKGGSALIPGLKTGDFPRRPLHPHKLNPKNHVTFAIFAPSREVVPPPPYVVIGIPSRIEIFKIKWHDALIPNKHQPFSRCSSTPTSTSTPPTRWPPPGP